MMMKMRRLACFAQGREMAQLDMDEPERIMTYNGLESCILSSHSYEIESGTSRGDGSRTDSTDEDNSSCSSSKDGFGSFSSHWVTKRVEQQMDEWETSESPRHSSLKDESGYATRNSDVDAMKEKFAKLLLGDDVSGGTKGLSTALALSNAITNLAAEVFGEMWKLEPLPTESKIKWKREKDWLLSPANYMVQLVPAKQSGANGATMEIMIPKARMDINMNLPALQKLDSLLIDTLDSMAKTEFWYMEGGSRHAEGRASNVEQGRRWWLPSPRVPTAGMSDTERKKLLYQSKMVLQVYKAAKSINENILLEMPVPTVIRDAIPKSGKTNLGEELHKVLNLESSSPEEMLNSLNLKSEHEALETVNRLEGAVLHWKGRIKEQACGKSPSSWSFMKDPLIELDKMELLMNRAEALLQLLRLTYPNLPQTFLEVTKIQYGKDIGHAILEAYSRALGNLAFKILSRIADVLHEDVLSNPNSPLPESYFQGINVSGVLGVSQGARQSFIEPMNRVGGRLEDSNACSKSYFEFTSDEGKSSSLTSTPSRGSVWCVGREACGRVSCENSP